MVTAVVPLPFVDGIVYGEGPRWRCGRLWFTDGPAGKVYSAGESGDLTVEVEVEHPSGLGWLPDGTLVVSSLFAPKVHYVGVEGAVHETFDISHVAWSTDDLVVTPDGRIFVDLYQRTGTALTDAHYSWWSTKLPMKGLPRASRWDGLCRRGSMCPVIDSQQHPRHDWALRCRQPFQSSPNAESGLVRVE
jgi:hypothetical protein